MKKLAVGGLSLSAAALVGLLLSEGYTGKAVVPVRGDVPTLGFGSTYHADGRRVQAGDTIEPVRAVITAHAHMTADEKRFRNSLPNVKLSQAEYDLYMDWVYQYGIGRWSASAMRDHLMAEQYSEACDALLEYRTAGGYDCSTMINGERNKRCWGVWQRQLDRHAKCVAAQGPQ